MPDKKHIRNSTAEFLIFSAQSGGDGLEVRYEDETIWLSQKLMARLFDVTVPTINEHLKNIFESGEIAEDSAIRKFRITAADGKAYNTQHWDRSDASSTPTSKLAKEYAESEFEKFRPRQDIDYRSDFDREVKRLEEKNKRADEQ